VVEPDVTDSLAPASSRGRVREEWGQNHGERLELVSRKDATMFGQIVQRMTAPFRRKRCPECGHKLRESYCDVCGYDLIEQTRNKLLRDRGGPV